MKILLSVKGCIRRAGIRNDRILGKAEVQFIILLENNIILF